MMVGYSGIQLTFQECGTLLDICSQLFKDAIDFLLCSDEMFEWRSIYLGHVSFILLYSNYGLGASEQQGHCAVGVGAI